MVPDDWKLLRWDGYSKSRENFWTTLRREDLLSGAEVEKKLHFCNLCSGVECLGFKSYHGSYWNIYCIQVKCKPTVVANRDLFRCKEFLWGILEIIQFILSDKHLDGAGWNLRHFLKKLKEWHFNKDQFFSEWIYEVIICPHSQGRNPCNFLFVFWEKRWLY